MVYGLVSTGNKPGGNSPNESGDVLPYNATDSTNIELGLRSTLAGARVLLNATLNFFNCLSITDKSYTYKGVP